ncbi:TPA: bifunctional methylenetetrahydrofolate dehydrogenase/methenyltetrahydrofolate cyclohydrolase, partial [Neisseria gonorrhoeae]
MSAQLINGKEVSQKHLQAIAEAVAQRQQDNLHTPCLAVVLVGGDP